MSSNKFTEKRIGYLAAAQSFHPETEVLMLTTNMIRKDLNSSNTYDAGLALSSLACFISPDLARDLNGDVLTMLTSTKPYLRKKAVLILYKVSGEAGLLPFTQGLLFVVLFCCINVIQYRIDPSFQVHCH